MKKGFKYFTWSLLLIMLVFSSPKAWGQLTQGFHPEEPDKMEISIYPNPSDGEFNFEAKSDFPVKVSLKIYNLTGKLVEDLSDKVEVDGGRITARIKMEEKLTGLHFIRLEAGGTVHTRKIVFR